MTSQTHKFIDTPDYTPALCDVAPTVLKLMGLDIPEEMTVKQNLTLDTLYIYNFFNYYYRGNL